MRGVFGKPFNRPIIAFGSSVEYYPVSAKDQSRIHQFGTKVLQGTFPGCVLYAGGIWKGDIMVADTEELEEMCRKMVNISHIPDRRWNRQVVWKRSGFPKNHLNQGSPCTRRRTRHFSRRVSTVRHAKARNDFWAIAGN